MACLRAASIAEHEAHHVSPPDLSLVICTRNRAEQLRAGLDHVARIRSRHSWEIVVVDNGSTDDTRHVVETAMESAPVRLRFLEEPVPNVSRARNRGAQATSGAILAFTDDDCYPRPTHVDDILERFAVDSGLGFVCGAVELYDPEDAGVATVTLPERLAFSQRSFVTPGIALTANLAFRRSAFDAIGGFDEVFAYGSGPGGGDVDAAVRVLAEGWRGLYDPALTVQHHHGRRPGPAVDAARRSYDVGRGIFYAKCAFDRRLRRTYLAGWTRLTWGRVRRGESLRPVVREMRGALRYAGLRARGVVRP
jgi:glycosyltransferase involved in cell wall biosynthesis